MQYVGMPHSWVDFYYKGFDAIIRKTAMNANCHFIWIQRTEKNEESIHNLYELLDYFIV